MSEMPDFPADNEALVKLTLAHQSYEQALKDYDDEIKKAYEQVGLKHNPFIWAAQSVLYEAMGNAALAGFSPAQLGQVMGCRNH